MSDSLPLPSDKFELKVLVHALGLSTAVGSLIGENILNYNFVKPDQRFRTYPSKVVVKAILRGEITAGTFEDIAYLVHHIDELKPEKYHEDAAWLNVQLNLFHKAQLYTDPQRAAEHAATLINALDGAGFTLSGFIQGKSGVGFDINRSPLNYVDYVTTSLILPSS